MSSFVKKSFPVHVGLSPLDGEVIVAEARFPAYVGMSLDLLAPHKAVWGNPHPKYCATPILCGTIVT